MASLIRLITSIAALTVCLAAGAQAQVTVVVASESWDQLLYLGDKNEPKGPLADFVRRMDEVQDKFHFELKLFPRLRLDQIFIDKAADVYPLRTTEWTRPELGLLPTKTIVHSGDLYFAKRDNRFGGGKVFADLASKNIVGVRGYHYRLFNNNADEAYIKKNFNAYLLASNEAVLKFILAGRADVGIVPEVIMAQYLKDPAMRAQLIVADRYDSRVELSNLVRKDGPISVAEMDAIIDSLVKAGDVDKLKKYFQAIKR
ncbi:MAG TPA: transporter substrate-binding domain-containing protein [Duganella sp.]|nr:transporter substrate-binding domain-containing protein [Duganella sp.]